MITGSGDFRYEVAENWPKWPEGWIVNNVCGISQNSKGVIYIFNRSEHPVIMVDHDGNVLGSWGEEYFEWPHGIFITPDDCVWLCDMILHTASKFTADGKLLMELGIKGQPSDTGRKDWVAYWQVEHSAGPFNMPTQAVEAPWGDIYVTDGYGNARVHIFSYDGKLKFSWGKPGTGPGEFMLPHDILIDDEANIFVGDRENMRIQIFTRDGKFIKQWAGIERPSGMCMDKYGNLFVTELSLHAKFPEVALPPLSPTPSVRVLSHKGETLASIGRAPEESRCCDPGYFFVPHACYVDADDNLYVGEPIDVIAQQGGVSPGCHCIQKFIHLR